MIFDLLIPPKGPRGVGGGWRGNFLSVAHPIYVSNSHTKFSWILVGLGGDSIPVGLSF